MLELTVYKNSKELWYWISLRINFWFRIMSKSRNKNSLTPNFKHYCAHRYLRKFYDLMFIVRQQSSLFHIYICISDLWFNFSISIVMFMFAYLLDYLCLKPYRHFIFKAYGGAVQWIVIRPSIYKLIIKQQKNHVQLLQQLTVTCTRYDRNSA